MIDITSADIERIRSTASKLVDDLHLPGMSVGVIKGDELVYAEGFGFADIESGRRQDPSLRQRIGSVTKTMVGLCTMALVEEGKLSLDDRVADRLPDLKFYGPAESLLVRHLMTHTNGIGEVPTMDDCINPWRLLWSDTSPVPPVKEAYSNGILIEVPPNTKYAYANHAFALLGEIIERVEGKPWEDILQERIFEPLRMTNTDCLDKPHPDLTTGYQHRLPHDERDILDVWCIDPPDEKLVDGHNIRGEYVYVRTRAAGTAQSTITDMAKYASMLLRKGEGIVKPSTFEAMITPQWRPDDRLAGIGITFFLRERFGRQTFGHGGGIIGGWNTQITVIPEEGLAVLVHVNMWSGMMSLIDGKIVQAVLDAPKSTFPEHSTDSEVLKTAVGVYEPTRGHLTNHRVVTTLGRIQITLENGGLMLRARRGAWREGVRMSPVDPSDPTFLVLDAETPEPPHVALVLNDNKGVIGIRFDQLTHLVKNEGLEPWV